jgi:hypothetical protein
MNTFSFAWKNKNEIVCCAWKIKRNRLPIFTRADAQAYIIHGREVNYTTVSLKKKRGFYGTQYDPTVVRSYYRFFSMGKMGI